jgi:hydrogenase maturation protease
MTEDDLHAEILVLGIGNPLWGDEGLGLKALEAFAALGPMPAGVRLLDGGTQGMYLLPHVRAARRLIVFDAVDFGLPPGEMLELRDDDVPRLMGARRLSLHQTTFQDVLAAATLIGGAPQAIRLIGVQCRTLENFGGPMSPEVEARIPDLAAAARAVLAEWGFS